ncbi:MAG: hypothetical protein D3M94_19245 [Rhodocyclales bacterium GT-UBC]|nr:MAG: hypothetical protein D3M94_19245 [Rhodocyclales bacterium GT-UBC]
MTLLLALGALAAIVSIDLAVSLQVLRSPMFSATQKTAQCAIVWLLPIIGPIGIWAFLRSQSDWKTFDTRAYPEHSEKMVVPTLDQSAQGISTPSADD